MRAPAGKCDEVLQEEKTHVRKDRQSLYLERRYRIKTQ